MSMPFPSARDEHDDANVMRSRATALKTALDAALAAHAGGPAICSFHAPEAGVDFTSLVEGDKRAEGPPLTAETPFRIASVTKIYTAAAIFRLWEQGRLSLEKAVSEFLPQETLRTLKRGGYAVDKIELRHLLAHTSGVYDHCHDPVFVAEVIAFPQRRWTRLEQIQFAVKHGSPYGPPGAQQHYSDTGYVLLGEIIERISDLELGAVLPSLLKLEELGLSATRMEDDAYRTAHGASLFHGRLNGEITGQLHPSFDLYGGGGLVSTARETSIFMRALLTGAVFERRQTLAAALAIPPAPIDPTYGRIRSYLLYRTDFLGRDCWGHTGFWGNETLYCPSLDLSATFSAFDGGDAGRGRRRILRSEIESAASSVLDADRLS